MAVLTLVIRWNLRVVKNLMTVTQKGKEIKVKFDELVTIDGAEDLTYLVSGNDLKVYPKEELKGTLEVTVYQGITSADNYELKNTYIFSAIQTSITSAAKWGYSANFQKLKI